MAIASASGSQRCGVVQTGFLEGRKGISAQHLGPLVAVIPCRVPAGKDVSEAAQETVFRHRRQHRGQRCHALLHVERGFGALRIEAMVQSDVQAGKVQLA